MTRDENEKTAREREKQNIPRGEITLRDEAYPDCLREIKDPPEKLYYRGNLSLLKTPMVSMVGSRRMTPYGKRIAAKIAGDIAAAGGTVVSGFAVGIDGMSHKGALEGGGSTIAVLGNGLDVLYPSAHRDLQKRILEQGLFLSEYPPDMRGTRYTFPKRNRIIAALGRATVVVEAGLASGSLITAALACEQGRPVYGVPGPIDSLYSLGVNILLRDGAIPLVVIKDLLTDLGLAQSKMESEEKNVGGDEAKILGFLRERGESTFDAVAEGLSLSPAMVTGIVSVLEMKGLVGTALGRVFLLDI